MQNSLVLLGVLSSLLLASGCSNTVEGVGKDMQRGGEAIQRSVRSEPNTQPSSEVKSQVDQKVDGPTQNQPQPQTQP